MKGCRPLAALNAVLASQGYVIHVAKVRDRTRVVACLDWDGRKEPYGLFELRRVAGDTSEDEESRQGTVATEGSSHERQQRPL